MCLSYRPRVEFYAHCVSLLLQVLPPKKRTFIEVSAIHAGEEYSIYRPVKHTDCFFCQLEDYEEYCPALVVEFKALEYCITIEHHLFGSR